MAAQGLSSHPSVVCFGELLRRKNKNLAGALKIVHELDPKFKDENYRMANPQEFIDAVYKQKANKPIVGFKLMLQQHFEYLENVITDSKCMKIFLHRQNFLACYSSDRIAKVTGQGIVGRYSEVKKATIPFEENNFRKYWNKNRLLINKTRRLLHQYGQPFLDVEYTSLVRGDGLSAMLRFLGVDASVDLEIHTKKRNPSNLLERFDNPNDVRQFLEANDLGAWMSEATNV